MRTRWQEFPAQDKWRLRARRPVRAPDALIAPYLRNLYNSHMMLLGGDSGALTPTVGFPWRTSVLSWPSPMNPDLYLLETRNRGKKHVQDIDF